MDRKYFIGSSTPTETVKQLRVTKQALVDNGLVDITTPNEMLPDAIEKGLENLKPENVKVGIQIGNTVGTYEGEGIKFNIPAPSNIIVDEGALIFDEPDLSEYADLPHNVKYLVTINDATTLTITTNRYNISSYLTNGLNTIDIQTEITFSFMENSGTENITSEYSKPERYILKLDTTLPGNQSNFYTVVYKNNIVFTCGDNGSYFFNPVSKQFSDYISNSGAGKKFVINNTLYGLSTYTINIYNETTNEFGINPDYPEQALSIRNIFGSLIDFTDAELISINNILYIINTDSTIYTFDGVKGQKLSVTLPVTYHDKPAFASIKNKIYIIGGTTDSETYVNGIYVFDTTNNVVSKIDIDLDIVTNYIGARELFAVTINDTIYLLGGQNKSTVNRYIYKYNIENNRLIPLELQLPISLSAEGGESCVAFNNLIYIFKRVSLQTIYEIKI